MDGENILTLNVANWVSILLIVLVSFAAYGLIGKFARSKMGATTATATTV